MMLEQTYRSRQRRDLLILFLIVLCIPIFFIIDIAYGSISIPLSETLSILTGGEAERLAWKVIIADTRLPQAISALSAGLALSVAGLLLQTFFRNPLAGPSVLGISSGASLGVAIAILGGTSFGISAIGMAGNIILIVAAIVGSLLVLLFILLFARISSSNSTILIAGLMIAYLVGASVQLLEQIASKEELQQFVYWGFGSFSGQTLQGAYLFLIITIAVVLPSLFFHRSLNAWLLGENYARTMGIPTASFRWRIIVLTGIITGLVTAYCGPIAFVGLAVPHLVKRLLRTKDHRILIPAVSACGAVICLLCSILSDSGLTQQPLPINAITSLFGAPLVIILLLRQRKWKGEQE